MRPINRILVPIDFSDGATRALEYAIDLAEAAEARLFVLHAYRTLPPVTTHSYAVATAYGKASADYPLIERAAEEQWEELMRCLNHKPIQYELIPVGNLPEKAIQQTVDQWAIDLVVMDSRHGIGEQWLGNTITYLMHHTACPLIIVPKDATFTKVNRILLVTDYPRIKHANTFQILVTLANVLRTRIEVLHITPKDPEFTSQRLVVEDLIDRLLRHAHHSYYHLENEDILDGLRMYQDTYQEEVGMIAMMPYDDNLWKHIAGSSTSENILFQTVRPVFVF